MEQTNENSGNPCGSTAMTGYMRCLLLASYCVDNDDCTDEFPCDDCLRMCNVIIVPTTKYEILGGLDYLKSI